MEQVHIMENPKGTYSCEIGISVAEWQKLLLDRDLTTPQYRYALMAFYNAPKHTSTSKELSQQYYRNEKDSKKFDSWITNYGKAIIERLNRFQIVDNDGSERFWLVAMSLGKLTNEGLFEWKLRPEIVQAIKNLGWNMHFTWIPFYIELADKLLLYKDNRKALLDLVYSLDERLTGYIRADDGGHVSDIDPFTVYGIFNRGITDENRFKICSHLKDIFKIKAEVPYEFDGVPVLNNQKSTFFYRKKIATDIQPLWDLFEAALNPNEKQLSECFDVVCKQHGIRWNITMGLYWIRPYDYISLDSRNRSYLPTLGIDVFDDADLNAINYSALLQSVRDKFASHVIKEINIPEISYRAWVGDEVLSNKNYWLVGYSFGSTNSQFDRFIADSIWEGRFNDDSPSDQKLLLLAKTVKVGDVLILKSTSTKGIQHDQPFFRVKAIAIVSNDIKEEKIEGATLCRCDVKYYGIKDYDFNNAEFASYRKTLHQADLKAKPIVDYANKVINEEKDMSQKQYQKYIDLLETNKNMILTGAPGTGKTYMAKAIAKEMGCTDDEICFVQFHPSYDYTDFVEGLRPTVDNGVVGFELRSGVFKEFCAEALQNFIDSKKSIQVLQQETSVRDKLNGFIEEAIDDGTEFKTSGTKNVFRIIENKERTIIVEVPANEKTSLVKLPKSDLIELMENHVTINGGKDIQEYFHRKYRTQQDSYVYVLYNKIMELAPQKNSIEVSLVMLKKYVFIIDEINRGEISKIFGELFFSIDPGYRGEKGRVKTQYSNIVESDDIFKDGFYVPDNVYIIGTMNDIDRSVESMDFAMRRRFTWQEVTAGESYTNMIEGDPDFVNVKDEIKTRMLNLNKAIVETEGLDEAYQIGAAYFRKCLDYLDKANPFDCLWENHLKGLLYEYLRGNRRAKELLEKLHKAYNQMSIDE